MTESIALFRRWPELNGRLPRVSLGTWPTPVVRLDLPGITAHGPRVWAKRDDLTATPYGGNKVRKLEFLLADALKHGARETLTFGAAGSNHAAATAIYARQLGLHPISVLSNQPNAAYVGRNLLMQHAIGTELHVVATREERERAAELICAQREADTGLRPYVVPMGGTSPLGTLGFVNAALELAEQIGAGEAMVPDVVYVALGSMGTAAGIILGLTIAGLRTRVVAVRVIALGVANEALLAGLIASTASLLRNLGATDVPDVPATAYEVRHDRIGEEYARFTPDGMAAVRTAKTAGLHLEGTYTGKTFAALLADTATRSLDGQDVLFWDTYNSHAMDRLIGDADWRDLPDAARDYFIRPVQELDTL